MAIHTHKFPRQRIAVVGAGISGLASAWLLGQRHQVTLFEGGAYLGGHTNTVEVTLEGKTAPVDTGFLVFNDRTYPNLIAMFEHLGVPSVPSDMSFAVSLQQPHLEWAGSSLATVFGQKRNLLRKDFWRMLGDILRFNREAVAYVSEHPEDEQTLGQYLQAGRYSAAFANWYLLPMAAAIWSCPTSEMLATPLSTFVRFCINHGLLQIFDRPVWRTVQGGGREYVKRLAAGIGDIRLACPVLAVHPRGDSVGIETARGVEQFDAVVLASHSDQSLALLGNNATPAQREVLGAIRYQPNRAVLHTDPALLPRNRKLWSAWNYLAGRGEPGEQPVSVSYLINQLQPLPFKAPVIVTLNPVREPRAEHVLREFDYAHPVFDGPAIAAQARLASVQGENRVWLCGAWGGYGFHEDGLKSALRVANALGVKAPWQGGGQSAEVA